MKNEELEYIIEIAECGSISKAANRLYISRSALTYCLQSVENEMGVSLFKRTAEGVRATEAGELYVDYAKKILEQYAKMRNEIHRIALPDIGSVTIGSPRSIAAIIAPAITKELPKRYPKISCKFVDRQAPQLETMLLHGDVDFLVIHLPVDADNIVSIPITNDRIVAVFPRGYADKIGCLIDVNGKKYVDMKYLIDTPCYLTSPTLRNRKIVQSALDKNRIELQNIQEMYSYHSIYGMIRNGYGFTISLLSFCGQYWEDKSLEFYPLLDNSPYGEIAFCYKKGAEISAIADNVAELCKDSINEYYSDMDKRLYKPRP